MHILAACAIWVNDLLKQFAMAITATMVVASVGTGVAAAARERPVDHLHQHQGIGPGGVKPPGIHHGQNPPHRGHGRAGG